MDAEENGWMRSGAVAEGLSVPLMVLGGTRFKYQPAWLPSQRRCRIHFRPEVEEQASHVTLRGAHSNSSKRELVVMAAPEPEVLSLAAVLDQSLHIRNGARVTASEIPAPFLCYLNRSSVS